MIENKRFKDKLAGKVRFPEDMASKRTLIGAVVRSTVSHGLIREILLPEIPENIVLIRASDIPGANRISVPGGQMPLLADRETIFKGEPILLAAGPDSEELESFIRSIRVEYDRLDDWSIPENPEDFAASRMIVKGDPEEVSRQGWKLIESRFSTPVQEHMSTPYLSAYVKPEGQKLIVNTSTQWPTNVIQNCSAVTGIQRKNISMRQNPTGKTMDSKLWMPSVTAAQAALLAQKSRKPVRLVYSSNEDFLCSPKRIPAEFEYKASIDESGRLTSLIISFLLDTGSSAMMTKEILDRVCIGAAGIYQCRNIKVTGQAFKSNNPPMGAFSGMGLAQAFFAVESLADMIAKELIIWQKEEIGRLIKEALEAGDEGKLKSARSRTTTDPALWRSRNFLIRGNTYLSGGKLRKNPPITELLETLTVRSDFTRKHAAFTNALQNRGSSHNSPFKRKGIGISTSFMGSNFLRRERALFAATVICRLDKEGTLSIITTSIPDNFILIKLWKQYASEILAIDEENIDISSDEENLIPQAGPATLSRSITVTTRLLIQCCEQIKKKRFRDPLPLEVKKTFKNSASRRWDTETFTGHPFQELSWGACAVEVEIDENTYSPLIRKVWLVMDCGLLLNRDSALAVVESEIMQAIGWCLTEELSGSSPGGYSLPGIDYLPDIDVHFRESSSRTANGLGGLVFNCLPAAFRNAVSQAARHDFTSLPIRPEEIYRALEDK